MRRTYPRIGHNTFNGHYQSLMYAGLRTSDTLHKKDCRVGPELFGTSENPQNANFAKTEFYEVQSAPVQYL
jgi:hypothetical protein